METKIPGVTLGGSSKMGTSLQGYVTTSYAKLVEVLGPPNDLGDEYKVSTEWELEYKGRTYTVYDYKETNLYDDGAPSVEEFRALPEYEWHIGAADDAKEFIALLAKATGGNGRPY